MLNQHPDLGLPRETRFLLGSWRRRNHWGDLSDSTNKVRLVNWIVNRKSSRFAKTGLPPDLAFERLVQAPPTLGSVLGTVFELYASSKGSHRWGDKRPAYIRQLNAIRSLFPEAQVVNVVRDPRAAIASMRRLGWYKGSIIEATDLWIRSASAGVKAGKRLDKDTFYEIRYEDLIQRTVPTVESLLGFLDLDFSWVEKMMKYHTSSDVPQNSYHALISTPVDESRIAAWKADLSDDEVCFVESVTAEYMELYGYAFESDRDSAPTELLERLEAHQDARAASSRPRG
jgi:hypothetical protein